MLAVCFFFEDYNNNVYSGDRHRLQIWRETAKALGADTYIIIDETTEGQGKAVEHEDQETTFERFESIEELHMAHPDARFVYVEVGASTSLWDYEHPQGDVVYVVGRDSGGSLPRADVYIPLPTSLSLWSLSATAIVLADRLRKAV